MMEDRTYTGHVSETGYYLGGVDIEDVRAKLDVLVKSGTVIVEPVDWASNASVGISAYDEAASKGDIEGLLGCQVLDEEDIILSDEYEFLRTFQLV